MSQGITLNGVFYKWGELQLFEETARTTQEVTFYQEVVDFLNRWLDASPTIAVYTSGSTGQPTLLQVRKEHMVNSAQLTCDYLGLKAGDTTLLCMPIRYIAGKMMLVRACVRQLHVWVVPPCGRPLGNLNQVFDFAAMVPLQIFNSMQEPTDKLRLQSVKHLLIGGGAIAPTMAANLKLFPHQVYSSYGMTETVSHIAMRRMSGVECSEWYYPFPSVVLSQTEDGALIIDAPLVTSERLQTHDVVEFNADGGFRVMGRLDNIINSGGVKFQPEKIEQKLKEVIAQPCIMTSRPDAKLGEALVLLIESSPFSLDLLNTQIQKVLSLYEVPKDIYFVEHLPRTETQKIRRADCKTVANKLYLDK